jgi:protein involved in plasmid replication-relaxation
MNGNNQRGIVIQPRDEHLLREIAAMRFVDREQTKLVAGFGSTTSANTRLLELYRAGLLRRFFQGTSAGGQKALYACSEKGAQLVGAPYTRLRYRNDELVVSTAFLAHLSWVNWVYCWARYTPCPLPGTPFHRWVSFPEPVAQSLTPDGYFEIATTDGSIGSFVEVDLGNEGPAIWKAKVRNYLQFAASRQFEKRFALPRFRVLVVAKDESGTQRLRRIVRTFTEKIFWFSALGLLQREGFWKPVWQRPANDEYRSLA